MVRKPQSVSSRGFRSLPAFEDGIPPKSVADPMRETHGRELLVVRLRVRLTDPLPIVEYDARMRRILIATGVAATMALLSTACSDDEPEITRAELLTEIEGRSLSEAEIEERESVARALCEMDDDVLRAVWAEMDNEQLAFQDFVFTQECGDRNPLYADSTGRFATEN